MQLDNEFEEIYFMHMPGSAEDIYDNIYVTYEENKQLVKKRQSESLVFSIFSGILFIPYKILVLTIFLFPLFCLFMTIAAPICK